ncbi:sugar ABC transporter substrate-binding protein [Chengkuizengella sediminis]|uniref:sugar ABC transporter substrate-binding protein n=1 Tax=Chengkuizengella sediminis TaxID=1885917 RepID=UPI00138941F7|nr:extracellular solute-binding protein [Chengkuizengella sediminis]NDI36184.1 extracellular solute-binding protein [Chengkuizengella sediminis]
MKFNKLFLSILAVIFIFGIAIVGCSTSDDEVSEQPTETENQSDESATENVATTDPEALRVAFGMAETEWDLFNNEILPAFESETGIKVEAVELKAEDLINSLTAQVESGQVTIDMFAQDINNLSGLVTRDLVEDLSAYNDNIPEAVIPGMLEATEFDGKRLFLPYRPNVEIAFYNESKFNELGLQVPTTWEELLNVAKAANDATGQGRVAIKANLQGDNILHMFDFIKQAGGDPYTLNDEGSVLAFEFLQELYPYLNEQSSTAAWDTMNEYLLKDSVYLGTNWPFYIPEFHNQGKDEIKAYSGWSGPVKESHVLGGEVIGIPTGSTKVDEAIQFAEFLMSKDVQELLVSELAWPSVRSDAYGLVQGYQEPYFEAIQKALNYAEPRGNEPYWADAEPIYLEVFQKVVVNGEDVKATLDEAAEKLSALK